VPHARSVASPRLGRGRGRGGAVGRSVGRTYIRTYVMCCEAEHLFVVDDSLMVNVTVGCQWALNRDCYQ
jgi:hypothetical protein